MYIRSCDDMFYLQMDLRRILTIGAERHGFALSAPGAASRPHQRNRFLLGVELDDQLLLDRHSQIFTHRKALDDPLEIVFFEFNPLRHPAADDRFERIPDRLDGAAFFADFNRVTGSDQVRRDVDAVTVNHEMVVAHEMATLGPRIHKAHAIDHVVQAPFQHDEQVRAGDALLAIGALEEDSKLLLGKPVHAFNLLLLTQLNTVVGNLAATAFTVLSRRVTPAIKSAFVRIAAIALEKELHIFTSA